METEDIPNYDEAKESIELTKNSKGYNWKIKLKEEAVTVQTIERLKLLDDQMQLNYGV